MAALTVAAAGADDLITPFLTGEYNDIINKSANNLGELLAIADSIHDFGKGYRNLPSQDGVREADRFLRNGYLSTYTHPAKEVLINGYNNIEATNRSFFETRANIPWVASLPKSTISVADIIAYDNVETVKSKAIESRDTNSSIEISPGAITISSLAKPDDEGKLSPDQLAALKKLEVFILTFLFGNPDEPCYFASDADAKNVGKILSQSTAATGMIFPQTIADSATTSLGRSLTKKADYYYFPHDSDDDNTFTSTANNFTNGEFKITYNNKGFSDDKPYAWEQIIESAVGGAGAGSPPSANLQYGPDTGVEGPSVDQLLQLQVKTRTSASPPAVRISTSRQFDLARSIGPIYTKIRDGITTNTNSLYMDIKRCGDQDQCLAVSYARRDPKFKGRVALITGDITCTIKNRCYDNPTVEHYNDRIRLYRSSRTERLLSLTEKLILQYRKLFNEIKQYEPIIIFFLNESRSTTFIDSILSITSDDEKIKDLKEYLAGAGASGAGGVVEHGLKTSIVFTEITGITLLKEDVSTKSDEDLTSINADLKSLVGKYRTEIDRIIKATSVTNTPPKTLEFLGWYVAHAAEMFDATTKKYPELQYDPDNENPVIDAGWDNYNGVTAPYDIIKMIDTYNKQLIKWCNSFFNQVVAHEILATKAIAFHGDSESIEQLKQLIDRLHSISLKSNIKNYDGLVVDRDILPMWKLAVTTLMESRGAELFTTDKLEELKSTMEGTLNRFPNALAYILDRSPPPRGKAMKPPLTAAAAAAPTRSAAAAVPTRSSRRLAAAAAGPAAGEEAAQQTGSKRKRGGGQIGGAACITRIDIVDELYDFFGTVAAIFRTKVYDTLPPGTIPHAARSAEEEHIDSNVVMYSNSAGLATNYSREAKRARIENDNVDMISNGSGSDNSAYEAPTPVEQILDNSSLQTWATENMYVYEQLFNELVLDKFTEQKLPADCSDYKTLLDIISNLFLLRDGKEALKFYLLISVIDDLLGKTKSPLIEYLIPNIGSLSIEILSNRGVEKLNRLIGVLLAGNFGVNEETMRLFRGGGRRRTQRRYSMRQYKKRSTTTARRHRRRTETRSNRGRN